MEMGSDDSALSRDAPGGDDTRDGRLFHAQQQSCTYSTVQTPPPPAQARAGTEIDGLR